MKAFIPSKVAEIVFALIFGFFGVAHFINAEAVTGAVPAYMPGDASIWVYLTGAALVAAAVAIIIGIQKTLACYLLAALLLIFVFTIHLQPALEGNPGSMLKDTALAMCAILIGNSAKK